MVVVEGDRTGSAEGTESTFCSLTDGAIVTFNLDGEEAGVLIGNKDNDLVGIDVGALSGDKILDGGLVPNTLTVGAGWFWALSFPKPPPEV